MLLFFLAHDKNLDYFYSGAPARKLAVGLSAHSPQAEGRGQHCRGQ